MSTATDTTLPGHLRPGAKQRRVVCAANRLVEMWMGLTPGRATYIVCGPRHFDPTMRAQIALRPEGKDVWARSEQGFIDQWGTFMTREEAMQVAKAAGQLLYTEDLPTEWLDSSHLY
jgi:hypothetical protein